MFKLQTALRGATYDGVVQIRELPNQGMIAIKGDLGDPTLRQAVSGLAHLDIPAPLHATYDHQRALCWMAGDELVLMLPYTDAADAARDLARQLRDIHALVHDISDARCVMRLSGAGGREVLAKLSPADMSPQNMPVGMFRRTRLAQVPAAFWLRDADTVDLMCFRSVAQYTFDLLSNAADPWGQIRYF